MKSFWSRKPATICWAGDQIMDHVKPLSIAIAIMTARCPTSTIPLPRLDCAVVPAPPHNPQPTDSRTMFEVQIDAAGS
jgi:hypothetical protein